MFQDRAGCGHHNGFARGAAGGVQAHNVILGDGKKSVRIVVAQILLFRKGQQLEVCSDLMLAGVMPASSCIVIGIFAPALLSAAPIRLYHFLFKERII